MAILSQANGKQCAVKHYYVNGKVKPAAVVGLIRGIGYQLKRDKKDHTAMVRRDIQHLLEQAGGFQAFKLNLTCQRKVTAT